MKHSERFALDHFLSEYPRDLPFDEVIERILDDEDDEVGVWDVAENYGRAGVVEMIDDLRHHFECVVDNMMKDLGQLKEGEKHDA
jgi:hypothetical protein